jgi:SAM-dependent methyltransferase
MVIDIGVVRNFWNARPCNIKHSDKTVGSTKYFNEVTERKFKVEPHIPTFASYAKYNGKRVLEIGCGIGTDAEQFLNAGAIYTGIDLSQESVDVTLQRLPCANIKVANIEEWCSDEKYDLIYSFGVLHHTPNIHKALANIRTMLKDNGEIKFMLYSQNSWKNLMIYLGLDQPEAQSGCPVANTYTFDQIRTLLSDFDLDLKKDHIFQYEIESYKKYKYEKTWFWKNMPECITRFLETRLGWHTLIHGIKK